MHAYWKARGERGAVRQGEDGDVEAVYVATESCLRVGRQDPLELAAE